MARQKITPKSFGFQSDADSAVAWIPNGNKSVIEDDIAVKLPTLRFKGIHNYVDEIWLQDASDAEIFEFANCLLKAADECGYIIPVKSADLMPIIYSRELIRNCLSKSDPKFFSTLQAILDETDDGLGVDYLSYTGQEHWSLAAPHRYYVEIAVGANRYYLNEIARAMKTCSRKSRTEIRNYLMAAESSLLKHTLFTLLPYHFNRPESLSQCKTTWQVIDFITGLNNRKVEQTLIHSLENEAKVIGISSIPLIQSFSSLFPWRDSIPFDIFYALAKRAIDGRALSA